MADVKVVLKNLLFVPKCKCCGKPADKDNLCARCASEIEKQRIPESKRKIDKKFEMVDGTYASYYYKSQARAAVLKSKFKNPAAFLNSVLVDISIDIQNILEQNNIDMIVAVPCHKSKYYTQEYDLPAEIARRIAEFTGTEYSDCVRKVRKTEKQHNLPISNRRVNLVNAFEVTADLTGKNILVIDDVVTTGSTLSAVATELKLAGADKVYAWAYTYNT